jgi:hypothetical protein
MRLLLARQGEFQNQYFYSCSTQDCKFYLNTHLNTNHNFNNYDINRWNCDEFRGMGCNIYCEDCINSIKINMLDILSEFVECTWGVCYNSVFNYIIKPHLNNLEMLKFFLQSTNMITNEYNNVNGYKMFGDLHQKLNEVESIQIKEFIQSEF